MRFDNEAGPVAVAMSGGVDSSLAAALLVERGYQVSGVTMQLWPTNLRQEQDSCCGPGAAIGARQVCQHLGLLHTSINRIQAFHTSVVEVFVQEYARGRTPNPCIACNREIKFRSLLDWARAQGFRWLATGHYARVRTLRGPARERPPNTGPLRYQLLRGVDPSRDQSYVLYMLGQEELARLIFPLGEMCKEEVRREAKRRNLPTAGRPESREICFIPDDDYRRFLAEHNPEAIRPGPIYDLGGKLLGQHRGLPYYTIGQRKGLGLTGKPTPLFVVHMDPEENALVVGPRQALLRIALEAEEVCFVSGNWPQSPLQIQVKVRYRAPLAPAQLIPLENKHVRVEFDKAQPAITPGQAVVFYREEEVLGGGTITFPTPVWPSLPNML